MASQGVTLLEALGLSGQFSGPQLEAVLTPTSGSDNTNSPKSTGGSVNASQAQAKALAKKMAAAQPYNWTGNQWAALNNIVMAESGWNIHAQNGSSGAYGIPQSLPGSKMASAGPNWQNSAETQIAWMLQYIAQRYGSPVKAWQFHLANGWY